MAAGARASSGWISKRRGPPPGGCWWRDRWRRSSSGSSDWPGRDQRERIVRGASGRVALGWTRVDGRVAGDPDRGPAWAMRLGTQNSSFARRPRGNPSRERERTARGSAAGCPARAVLSSSSVIPPSRRVGPPPQRLARQGRRRWSYSAGLVEPRSAARGEARREDLGGRAGHSPGGGGANRLVPRQVHVARTRIQEIAGARSSSSPAGTRFGRGRVVVGQEVLDHDGEQNRCAPRPRQHPCSLGRDARDRVAAVHDQRLHSAGRRPRGRPLAEAASCAGSRARPRSRQVVAPQRRPVSRRKKPAAVVVATRPPARVAPVAGHPGDAG